MGRARGVSLHGLVTNSRTNYCGLISSCTIFALPVVTFLMIVQRHMVGSLIAGAVKG
jgi:ABC-type glycerol-3-phosphate transport system permease component